VTTIKSILVFILFLPVFALGQVADNTNRHNEKNIYYQALVKCVSDSSGNTLSLKNDSIFIEKDSYITDSLLSGVGNIKFIQLSQPDIITYLRTRKKLKIYKIVPLSVEDGIFSITIIPFSVSYEKRKKMFHYINSGGFEVKFKYHDGKFIFTSLEVHGI